jgi:hypothetical protein
MSICVTLSGAVAARECAARETKSKNSVGSALEGVFQPSKRSAQHGLALHGDHVEAAGERPSGLSCRKTGGGASQLLLAPIDTAERATPLSVFSVADFDEYYCIAIKHDQIKLAAFASPVLRQQAQTLP